MATTESYNVAQLPRRRGRPRLRKKSIAELEREIEMKTIPNVFQEESNTRAHVGEVDGSSEFNEESSEDDARSASEENLSPISSADEDNTPKPVGSPIRSADHKPGELLYKAYEWCGEIYELEDAVMVTPEYGELRPGVAIIKKIRQSEDGEMFATLRWLYRPEAVDFIQDDPRWLQCDPRELFLTDFTDDISVVNIMYKCVVHFLPSHKQLPIRKVHPGFVVQHYFDRSKQRVFKITQEVHWNGPLQKEICSRMKETEIRVGNVPDICNEGKAAYSKGNHEPFLPTQQHKIRTSNKPKLHMKSPNIQILSTYGVLRDDDRRNKYLEKLLDAMRSQWNFIKNQRDERGEYLGIHLKWPDCVIRPLFSLENEADITYEGDTHKYNQKMRQLVFNLKNNGVLAKRFVTQELNPSTLLNMSPEELKAGLTAEELPRDDSDDRQEIQMVYAHCKRCSEKKVRLLGVIQAGSKERYELQCDECGNTWFDSRNEIS